MQDVALFLLFTSIEKDLVEHIRRFSDGAPRLTADELEKARQRMSLRRGGESDSDDACDLLFGLDIGEKFDALRRHKDKMDYSTRAYFDGLANIFQRIIPVRNSVMHGRPLLIDEQVLALSLANRLSSTSSLWPNLKSAQESYTKDPVSFLSNSISFWETMTPTEVLHNLPSPDYADTGFLPRPTLEKDLIKKLLGRHPVVTILGDGGNGKTALALQTLYGLLGSNDHPFEAILWYTAKTSKLTETGIRAISDVVTDSLSIINAFAEFEPGTGSAIGRLRELLGNSKILLAIDNLETITGEEIRELAADIPGQSKLLLTSRVPLGGDISVTVGEFTESESIVYLQRLIQAYDVTQLKGIDNAALKKFASRLGYKPLLLKWLVLGAKRGLSPDAIVANPENALRFCLDNVIDRLRPEAQAVIVVLATVPMSCSPALIAEVSELSSSDIVLGLNELTMFSLVEYEKSAASEQLFKIRPFVRSYVTRIVAPKPLITNRLLAKYRRIETDYQSLRARPAEDPFQIRSIKVQSRSGMLTAEKIRRGISATFEERFEDAERVTSEAKMSDPGNFEVYRFEAFLAQQMADLSRSNASFENALELAGDQPQLWYFFGASLMRQLENVRASECFERAIELGGSKFPVYRDGARNEFMLFRFDRAEIFITKAGEIKSLNARERTILADLTLQLCVRRIEYYMLNSRYADAEAEVVKLANALGRLCEDELDEKLVGHVRKVLPSLDLLVAQRRGDGLSIKLINRFLGCHRAADAGESWESVVSNADFRVGTLKVIAPGNYGFLREADGAETFVHKSAVSGYVWGRLINGDSARYRTEVGRLGKPQACDVVLATPATRSGGA